MTEEQFSELYDLLEEMGKKLLNGADSDRLREVVKKIAKRLGLNVSEIETYTQAGILELE